MNNSGMIWSLQFPVSVLFVMYIPFKNAVDVASNGERFTLPNEN
jgi:hypothetical protein